MSLPKYPMNPSDMTRDDVINQIVSSIAMEELGMSHILNAEGEKLQYVLGTLSGMSGSDATLDQVLQANDSVQKLLRTASYGQVLLSNKMKDALRATTMIGPTGATGVTGATGSIEAGTLFYVEARGAEGAVVPRTRAAVEVKGAIENEGTLSIVSETLVVGLDPETNQVNVDLPVDLGVAQEYNPDNLANYKKGEIIYIGDKYYMVNSDSPGEIGVLPDISADYTPINPDKPTIINEFAPSSNPVESDLVEDEVIIRNNLLYRVKIAGTTGTPGESDAQFELISPPRQVDFFIAKSTTMPYRKYNYGDTIMFDDFIVTGDPGVELDLSSGVFTLKNGTYRISWQLNCQGASSSDPIVYNVDTTLMVGDSEYVTSTVAVGYAIAAVGSTMLRVSEPTEDIYLKLTSPSTSLTLVGGGWQATLIISKDV